MVRLKDVDKQLLDLFHEGDRTQSYLVDETGYTRQYIHQRLEVLEAAGYIENIHAKSALYHLITDPRENTTNDQETDS
ncbi:MarR family transcriptional regulator [Haladaptatus halobius]|uniref:MarR family transcriptional regulator n=1 Tax=Haladaptatus halobius TaxID=2884875 RepID=UPI001D0B4B3B|nr:helix-turn-helix domain-containing protein [Haladaptatus halobius]